MNIQRVQYALKQGDNPTERTIYHFETDESVVIMRDGRTLEEYINDLDDSHKHTGKTIVAGEGEHVVVTDPDGTIAVSRVSTKELDALFGIEDNVQYQLNTLVKEGSKNGYVNVQDNELRVYEHPLIKDSGQFGINTQDDEGEVTEPGHRYIEFYGLKGLGVDEYGHVANLTLGHYRMPRPVQFFNTSVEPTGQYNGDFWLETISVSVEPGNNFTEDVDGDLGKTETVGEETSGKYSMEDIDTGEILYGMNFTDFKVVDDI